MYNVLKVFYSQQQNTNKTPLASKTIKTKVEPFFLFKSLRKTKVFPVKTLKTMVFGSLGTYYVGVWILHALGVLHGFAIFAPFSGARVSDYDYVTKGFVVLFLTRKHVNVNKRPESFKFYPPKTHLKLGVCECLDLYRFSLL